MDEFDFIVVGGGSSGSIVASRLSDSGASVCLIESGPMDRSPWIHIPGGAAKIHNHPGYTWSYEAEGPQGTGRRIAARQGRVIGGSGSINGMMINRGAARDFEAWTRPGNEGWRYADVLPYFRRLENRAGGDDRYRGREGPLPVADSDWPHPLALAFRDAAVNAGLRPEPDYNGPAPDGISTIQLNLQKGRRVSSARAFLHPAMRRNRLLDVRTEAHATKVLFEGLRAVGVRYVRGGPGGAAVDVRARREVILCASACATPKLLQISGVGPAEVLRDIGVPVVQALAGVGRNLQDHYHIRYTVRIRDALTINNVATGPRLWGEVLKWLTGRPGVVGSSPFPVLAFARSDPALPAPDVTLIFSPGSFTAATRKITPVPGASVIVWQMRPTSRGYVRARSADPFELPEINPHYLSTDEDCRALVGGIRMARKIVSSEPFAKYMIQEDAPGAGAASDAALLDFARNTGMTAFHFAGSCRMAPGTDPMAVVDDHLRVHGLEGLRVADASIMPSISSGNTNCPTMMIAEKASDLILGKSLEPARNLGRAA